MGATISSRRQASPSAALVAVGAVPKERLAADGREQPVAPDKHKWIVHFTVGTPDAIGEAGAEAELEAVDRDVVEHRVWPRQIDVLKDARARLALSTLLRLQLPCLCSNDT